MRNVYVPRVGLDRVTLHNVVLIAIVDWSKLNQENVKWHPPSYPSRSYRTTDGNCVGTIDISEAGPEAKFKEIHFGFKYGKYGNITFSPRHVYGENFHNMTVESMQSHLLYLTEYFTDTYGIVVDFTVSAYTTLELNVTIPLNNPFDDYRRVLLAIEANVPYYGKKGIARYDKVKDKSSLANTGIDGGGNSFQPIIYDKKEEMYKKKEKIPDDVLSEVDYMRVEFRLKTTDKIKHVFSTADIGSITQDDVSRAYADLFDKYIRRGYEKWRACAQKLLRSRVRETYDQRNSGKRQWISVLFQRLRSEEQKGQYPIVLDKKQLIEEIQRLPIGHGNRSRTVKSIERHLTKNDVFDEDGFEKIEEIFSKVDFARILYNKFRKFIKS